MPIDAKRLIPNAEMSVRLCGKASEVIRNMKRRYVRVGAICCSGLNEPLHGKQSW